MFTGRAFSKLFRTVDRKSSRFTQDSQRHLSGFGLAHSQYFGGRGPGYYVEGSFASNVNCLGSRGHVLIARAFGCPSSIHEVEEDFESENSKHVRSYSKCVGSEQIAQKLSVRIEPPRAGILDKEVLRKRRTQPFSDKCWMQSLGVGLYRDKMRNKRWYSSQVLKDQSEDSSKLDVVEADEVIEEVGVIDTDSDEDDHEDCGPRSGIISTIKEESLEALEASLKELEAELKPEDPRIGTVCLRLAQLYDSSEEEPEKVLSYGQRALDIAKSQPTSFETAMCYHVLGSAYYKIDHSAKAIEHLENAAKILDEIAAAPSKEKEVGTIRYAVQILLGHSKMSLGKQEDALKHYENGVAINERILEPGNPDLARSYQQAAEALVEAEEYDQALKLCMKALPIYTNFYGSNSLEVAVLRRLIALIYDDLEDFEKVIAENEMIRPILVKLGKSKEIASLDLASGEALISLDKYKDAIAKLKDVVKETKETSRFHGHALVLIAKAYTELNEGKNAVKYCKKAFNALKNKKYSLEAGTSLMELGGVYQQLNELEQAMAVLETALAIYKHHPEQRGALADIEGQIGLLYIFMGKVEEGLPYLERSEAIIQDIYGEDSDELLAVYNHIAIAYLELGRFEEALAKFEAAKVIATEKYGMEDGSTIAIYANLANTYEGLERFDKAIECQKHVVSTIKKDGSAFEITLEDAEKKLKELLQKNK